MSSPIKLLIMDCDGVLSDGKIIYNEKKIESKNFSAKDGLGIILLNFTKIVPAVITGRRSNLLTQRCKDLKIKHLHQKVDNKVEKAELIMKELGIAWENVAYIGDDWNDYPVVEKAGLTAAPNDAFDNFKEKVDFVTKRNGGNGAVREFIEYILNKENIYDKTLDKFIENLKNS